MKRYVNGVEADLSPQTNVEIIRLADRLMVRTAEGSRSALAVRIGDAVHVSYRGRVFVVEKPASVRRAQSAVSSGEIKATMPGQIVDVYVQAGQPVAAGDKIVVLEAMKTQQSFVAPFAGVVKQVGVKKGQQVADGEVLAVIVES